MCFQSYALWPHMIVRDNVRFGLNVRKPTARRGPARRRRPSLVPMSELRDRKPNQLSGGQQQRVALAGRWRDQPTACCSTSRSPTSTPSFATRCARDPPHLQVRGVTTIYVTHDQKEALSVADRIAVMDRGRIAQVGTPADLYHRPASAFVAQFMATRT
jgi:ABC-type Fe3+/spermidine/putrescine transport system ATPase subunit